jgi:hypothetical protein
MATSCDQLDFQYNCILRDSQEAFERIKNIEFAVFPRLACDLQQLHRVIGEGDNKANQPLDRRDT